MSSTHFSKLMGKLVRATAPPATKDTDTYESYYNTISDSLDFHWGSGIWYGTKFITSTSTSTSSSTTVTTTSTSTSTSTTTSTSTSTSTSTTTTL